MQGTIMYGYGGYYVEWYTDDDGGSGYGDNPRRTVWYGTRAECKALAKGNPPKGCVWTPVGSWEPDASPGSAVWCETYADNH